MNPNAGVVPQPVGPCPYATCNVVGELRQGEIISNLEQYVVTPRPGGDPDARDVDAIPLPFVIVATPDCDLLQDFNLEAAQKKLNEVLLFEADEADAARQKMGKGRKEWKQIAENHVAQFHVLKSVPVELDSGGVGVPELLVNFKRYFSLPADEIVRQCNAANGARRRSRLTDVWRENFHQRAMAYLSRVAVPDVDD